MVKFILYEEHEKLYKYVGEFDKLEDARFQLNSVKNNQQKTVKQEIVPFYDEDKPPKKLTREQIEKKISSKRDLFPKAYHFLK